LEWVNLSNKLISAVIASCVDLCFIDIKELGSDFDYTTCSIPNWYSALPALSITVGIYNALIYPVFPLGINTLLKDSLDIKKDYDYFLQLLNCFSVIFTTFSYISIYTCSFTSFIAYNFSYCQCPGFQGLY